MSFWQNIPSYFSSEYYTFWVVSIGAGIICFGAGIVGTFSYLRKRALRRRHARRTAIKTGQRKPQADLYR